MVKNFNEWLLENEGHEPKDPQTYEEVKALLDEWYIGHYTINDDLTVDVDGTVHLNSRIKNSGYKHIPIKFRRINGHFDIDDNELKSLEGLAEGFSCGNFWCRFNLLENFKGLPKEFNINKFNSSKLYCDRNHLTSLEGLSDRLNYENIRFNDNKTVSSHILYDLARLMHREKLTWKQALIKHFDEIPEGEWSQMTLEGQKLLPKDEFKKKYIGVIASKRLGL